MRVRPSPAAQEGLDPEDNMTVLSEPASYDINARLFAAELSKHIPQIDLHGFRVDAVETRLDVFLYHETQKNTDAVRVVYGVGNDVLRPAVLHFLEYHPLAAAVKECEGYCIVLL